MYEPIAISSPCAMLITPIRPNTMVSPSAISTSTENSENPLKTCITSVSRVMPSLPVAAH